LPSPAELIGCAVRIALIVTGGVDRSGRERVIPVLLSFLERLARRHEVVVYALRYYEQPCTYTLAGATVHDLGRPEGLRRQYTALIGRLRRDGPFDVVHGYWALPGGLLAAIAGQHLRIASVVTADSGEFVSLPAFEYGLQRHLRHRLAVRVATRLASRVTVCTRYMQRLAAQHGSHAEVIPLGVDRAMFHPEGTNAGAIRSGVGDGPPWRLLNVASINRVKDHALLLRALRIVIDRLAPSEISLDLVGEDTLDGAMQTLSRELRLDGHITFHGALPSDAVSQLYRHAHAVVVSSRHEAASVVALEAASSGVAVVGTHVGYLADWSPDAALTISSFEPSDLADAVIRLLHDRPRRSSLVATARTWALAHDADWTVEQFDRLYQALRRAPA
jgi:glycosyltransferase involved in cell wall biosynthesis